MLNYEVLNRLRDACHVIAKEKGFWDEVPNDGEKIALMHSELSGALNALRHGDFEDETCPGFEFSHTKLALVVIRIFDFCGHHDIDLAGAVRAKMTYNTERPYKHGKEF